MPRVAVLGLLLVLAALGSPGVGAAQDGPTGSAGPPVQSGPTGEAGPVAPPADSSPGPPPPPPSARGWRPGPCPTVPRDLLITDLRIDLPARGDAVLLVRTARTVRLTATVRGERTTVRTVRRCRVTRVRLGRRHGTMTVRAEAGDVMDRRRFPF